MHAPISLRSDYYSKRKERNWNPRYFFGMASVVLYGGMRTGDRASNGFPPGWPTDIESVQELQYVASPTTCPRKKNDAEDDYTLLFIYTTIPPKRQPLLRR